MRSKRCHGVRSARALAAWGLLSALWAIPILSSAAPLLDEQTEALIVDAVEAAFELDLYNSRCRQDRSGRRTENLNKALASGFRMTVIDAQDDLFPEGYYRDVQERMTRDFLARLRAMGGCAGAKEAKLRNELRARYEQAMEQLEQFP
ncbi:hypothetical protein [Halochromatium glycolicum]|uniref:hypothetical protein n=1 Tax=Halochromatium glycolicum TaxID=85075 RepID=UPI001F5BED66|nr:hypothetical protein [Halochromatium glycolicum]